MSTSTYKKPYHVEFSIENFLAQPPKFTGKNTVFCTKNASFFLLGENLNIITNNRKLRPFAFTSNKPTPNKKFVISNFVAGVFKFLNLHKLSDDKRRKYFTCVRRHMQITCDAIKKRRQSPFNNHNQTRTYFRFSVDSKTYYFGIYVPCEKGNCVVCPTHVTRHHTLCWVHSHQQQQQTSPPPPHHRTIFNNIPKTVCSNRLGISYRKEVSYSTRRGAYYIVCSDFRQTSQKKQCINRFERLTRSPRSNHANKLITPNRRSTATLCKHNAVSVRVNLTNVANRFFRRNPDLLPLSFRPGVNTTLDTVLPLVATTMPNFPPSPFVTISPESSPSPPPLLGFTYQDGRIRLVFRSDDEDE